MPARLAVVTARSPRRARRLHRRRSRVLVGLLAALIATLAPVESPVPLGPLDDLAGSAPAEAQTAITAGTPDPCPTGLQPGHPDGRPVVNPDDASLCVLSQFACPEHPLQPGHTWCRQPSSPTSARKPSYLIRSTPPCTRTART